MVETFFAFISFLLKFGLYLLQTANQRFPIQR